MEDPNEAYAVRAYRRNKDLEERICALEAELAKGREWWSGLSDENRRLRERIGTLEAQVAEMQRYVDDQGTEIQGWRNNCTGRHGSQTPCFESPAKYGTCPLCTGQGGAHFPTCEYSPAETTAQP